MTVIRDRLFEIACYQTESEGERAPLGFLRSGRPVWPITGAEPDDDDDDDDDDDTDDDADDTDDDSDSGGAGKKKSKSDKDKDDDGESSISTEEFERLKRRMKRADQRATKAETELNDLKRVGTPEDEQRKADLESATSEVERLSEANKTLTLQNSFLLHNKQDWHDPELVMSMVLKDEDVEVDEDGHVSGMESALKLIAKKKPFLIKPAKSSDDDDDDDDDDDVEEPARQRSSGAPQSRRKSKGGLDRQKILETYPALNRR